MSIKRMCSLSEFVFNFLPHKDISDFHRDFFFGGGVVIAKYLLQTQLTGYATDNNHNGDL